MKTVSPLTEGGNHEDYGLFGCVVKVGRAYAMDSNDLLTNLEPMGICYLMISFALLVVVTANETPQQVVTRYNNYKAICNGMGYENVRCKDPIDFQSSLTKPLENLKNYEIVIFDKVSLNEGNAYDHVTGIFTAPLDGIYSFTWTTLTKAGKYFVTEIMLNGKTVAFNNTDGRGHSGNPMSTSHANIKMKKGDKVWIRTHGSGGQFAHANWCFFSGSKL
ncbi:complement C1q tumor necrosis factor-related protein 3-like [Crassostrea angulata]|uniref:complement C1q tumor necrosis factor-related protein 3-like n=1 Tax=Magallana angulata TaxID=2784310 RepID=UPI0022B10623|nr:complement C1q tumor necrosis factor-related protein 3-like [Crassostrea angulata]